MLLDAIGALAGVPPGLERPVRQGSGITAEQLKRMRRAEAQAAAQEISAGLRQARADFIESVRRSGRIRAEWTFDNIRHDSANTEALDLARGFADAGSCGQGEPLLLLLSGEAGSGKTVAAHAVANAWLENTVKVPVIMDFGAIKKLKFFNAREEWQAIKERREQWEQLLQTSLLIVDSLCGNCEGLSVYDQKILTELLRTRRAAELPLMITTPVSFNNLHTTIGDNCFESLKEYSVMCGTLLGGSRRNPIVVNGRRL